ncbi:MAG: major outer membrane protein [Arcobacter sp.]|uniref:major outer membrane protein n=1 Tax=Arcobacter sp. TaxID=1872629 RepID=UPI002A748800|nr:major outer membrane protein [Arcobacter sp.]MDY3205109.1 major outer membrane protein [Arcobacter sp.]
MKKIAKLSLVAAVAVAGLTSANAQPLEEAIKNVDVSGSVVYRYNDYRNDVTGAANPTSNNNNYKVGVNLSSKVNEDVKFNSRFIVGQPSANGGAAGADGDNGFATLDSSVNGDQGVDVTLSHAYFGYTGIANTTVNVGKQGLTTPWTVALDSDSNEQTGTGILALSTMGPVTLAGAYFNQTNLDDSGDVNIGDGSEDIATVGAITTLGPVTADAWYLDAQDIFDTYTIGAKGAFDVSGIKLGADARWVSLDLDGTNQPDNTMAKIVLTGDAGLVDAKVAYAMTDDEGGLTALDNDAVTTLLGWNLTINNKADADYWQAVLGFDILSNLNLSANYGNVEWTPAANTTREQEEVYAQLLYKMSKNLTTYVRYGTFTDETSTAGATTEINDDTRGRLQVEYTF